MTGTVVVVVEDDTPGRSSFYFNLSSLLIRRHTQNELFLTRLLACLLGFYISLRKDKDARSKVERERALEAMGTKNLLWLGYESSCGKHV